MKRSSRVLVICDGTFPSFVALWSRCAMGARPGDVTEIVAWTSPALGPNAVDTARRHASLCRAEKFEIDDAAAILADASHEHGEGMAQSITLLRAAAAALAAGCTELVWPVQFGGTGFDAIETAEMEQLSGRMAAAADRALLCSRLASIGHGEPHLAISISTPMIELSDRQVVDLAVDLGVPINDALAGINGDRWRRAMKQLGVDALAGAA